MQYEFYKKLFKKATNFKTGKGLLKNNKLNANF